MNFTFRKAMIPIKDITNYLEQWAPLCYQEDYDNSGLLVGDPHQTVTGVLICLDVTEAVIEEAVHTGCNLIIAHHPLIFPAIKNITKSTHKGRCIMQAIKHDITIYAMHTNLDNVATGINGHMATRLNLQQQCVLQPKSSTLQRLTVYVPLASVDVVRDALHAAGAGNIGNYTHCSFRTTGTGTFQPNDVANPTIGHKGTLEQVEEYKLEVIFPTYLSKHIIQAMQKAHPYEEVAYLIQPLGNQNHQVGGGMIGDLETALDTHAFLVYLKDTMQLQHIRHSVPNHNNIKRVALCGGAGISLLPEALKNGADAFITADVKYHNFCDAAEKILLVDIGHYESEVGMKQLLHSNLSEQYKTIRLLISQSTSNPVCYFC